MKKIIIVMLLMAGITGIHAQTITVASDRDPDADFSKYKTFYWTSQVDSKLDEGYYFLNDLILKSQVRDAVKGELMGLGYTPDPTEPDLIVSFRVFDKPTQIKGMEGYGTGFWDDRNYRSISDTTTYDIEAGTLLISLVDRKNGKMVWNGFASGLIDDNQFIKDEGKIREAVNMIIDEYDVRAREYSKR